MAPQSRKDGKAIEDGENTDNDVDFKAELLSVMIPTKTTLANLPSNQLSTISFAGCGFLCIYHVGVAAALRMFVPEMLRKRWTLYGSSSGALAAAVLLCGEHSNSNLGSAARILLANADQARNILRQPLKALDFKGSLRAGIEEMLPENAHAICSGRLHISLTRMRDFRNVIVSDYSSRQELVDAIICSCYIVGLLGWLPPTFRGDYYGDGAFSNNQPVANRHTVTVNPFNGESDICPLDTASGSYLHMNLNGTSIRLTSTNIHRAFNILFPPAHAESEQLYRLGFVDACRYLHTRANIPIHPHHLPMKSSARIARVQTWPGGRLSEHQRDKNNNQTTKEKKGDEKAILLPDEVRAVFDKYIS